jgi:integrase
MKIQSYKKDKKTFYRFCLYAGIDPVTEKQKQIRRSGFETRQAAELAYAKLKASESNGSIKEYRMDDVCDLWLKDYEHTVKGSSYKKTNEMVQNHIKPFFKNVQMDKISQRMAQDFTNQMYKKLVRGHSIVALAKRLCEYSRITLRAMDRNPFNDTMRPRRKKSDKEKDNFYNKEELMEFFSCAKRDLSPTWYLFFYLLAHTGLRRGEALVLTFDDVDFKGRTLTVNKTLSIDRDGNTDVLSTKTATSERVIDLDPKTTYKLKQWLYKHKKDTYIFQNSKGSYITPSQPLRKLEQLARKNGLKLISPHGFRHTHCSMLFAAGVPIPLVQARLGHKDIRTTMNIYNHVYKEDKREAVIKYIDYLKTS